MKMCAGVHAGERAAGDEEPGHVGLERLGIVDAAPRRSFSATPAPRHQIPVGVIADQQEHRVGRQLLDCRCRSSTTTDVGRISVTQVLKRAAIDPSLIRFSMSGLTQYLIVDFSSGRRCTSVT